MVRTPNLHMDDEEDQTPEDQSIAIPKSPPLPSVPEAIYNIPPPLLCAPFCAPHSAMGPLESHQTFQTEQPALLNTESNTAEVDSKDSPTKIHAISRPTRHCAPDQKKSLMNL